MRVQYCYLVIKYQKLHGHIVTVTALTYQTHVLQLDQIISDELKPVAGTGSDTVGGSDSNPEALSIWKLAVRLRNISAHVNDEH